MDFWREARAQHSDPIQAWASIVQDEAKRHRWQRARGKGGYRRATWDECLELVASAMLYTAKKYGPDRCAAFAPIPAYSYLSYGAGSRFIQLFGGFNMSFYDWYADLPNSFPEVWGDQTDVCESADWYNSKFIVSNAANLNMTRTADVHFVSEARHNGTKFVVLAPDFSQVAKYSDWWIPVKAGQDQALWMGADHVILKEFYIDRQVPYFIDYQKRYTDGPMLVKVHPTKGGAYTMGQFLRANRISRYKEVENGNWQLLVWDKTTGPRMPKGCIGYRWAMTERGKWNLSMEDAQDNTPLDPVLSFLGQQDEVAQVEFDIFGTGKVARRGVPIKYLETSEGKVGSPPPSTCCWPSLRSAGPA
jgi:nitrate reductase alpha subunit